MIPEFFLSLRAKTSRDARKAGLVNEQVAIHFREKRCRNFWFSHRQKCQNLILEQIKNLPQKKRVLILGSGLFHEIPLKKLSDEFHEVVACDVVHLPLARALAKSLPNVKLVSQDLSHWLHKLSNKPISKAGWLNTDVPTFFQEEEWDFVISANLLSQLPLAPKKVLKKLPKKHEVTESEIEEFSGRIMDQHIEYLRNFKCPTLLLSDFETEVIDPKNQLLDTYPLPIKAHLPVAIKTWTWHIAPLGEVSNEYSLQMKVSGFILNKRTK